MTLPRKGNFNAATQVLIENYYKGLKDYNHSNILRAKEYFIKVIKPIFSKPELCDSKIDIKNVKEIVLNNMHMLAKIYDKNNDYVEAAALHQYCHNFSREYNINSNIDFLKNAHLVEESFLKTLNLNSYSYINSVAKTNQNKVGLSNFRRQAGEAISDLYFKDLEIRVERVEEIYKTCTSFFVDLLKNLIHDCILQLGPPSEGCNYTVVGLGSIAGGKITPYSDIEFAILINKDLEEYKQYFRHLTKLLNIKVINFGETPLYMVGIEALNNVKTLKPEDDWFFLDNVTKSGFCFDSTRAHACKIPLGRIGYNKKDDYELICTPMKMLEFQSEESTLRYAKSWFESDPHLVYGLRHLRFIEGNKNLLIEYQEGLKYIIPNQICQERSLEIMNDDIKNIGLKLSSNYDGKEFNIKKDIYRIIDTTINLLWDYYGFTPTAGKSGCTSWKQIQQIEKAGYLCQKNAQYLKQAVSIASELRLAIYSRNSQANNLLLVGEQELGYEKLLKHYYFIMIPFQAILSKFVVSNNQANLALKQEIIFDDSDYIKFMFCTRVSKIHEALKHERNIELYDLDESALENLFSFCMKIQDKTNIAEIIQEYYLVVQNNSGSLNKLGLAKFALAEYEAACGLFYNALESVKNLNNELHQADSYTHLIKCFYIRIILNKNDPERDYLTKNIKEYYEKSKTIYDRLDSKLSLSKLYDIMGCVRYNIDEDYTLASVFFEKALTLKHSLYSKITYSTEIAKSYEYLSVTSYSRGETNKALDYIKKNICIQQSAYSDIELSRDISNSFAIAASIYLEKEQYSNAIYCYKELIKVYRYRNDNKLCNDLVGMRDNYNLLEDTYRKVGLWTEAIYDELSISMIRANVQNQLDHHLPMLSMAIQKNNPLEAQKIIETYEQNIGLYTIDENLCHFLTPIEQEIIPNYGVSSIHLAAFSDCEIEWEL